MCQMNGWKTLSRANGTPFASQDACVSYGAHGGKVGQRIKFTSSSPSPTVGDTYTPTATASSGLPVRIALDAASTGCSLSGGVVSFTAGGTCVIDANQAGNAVWAPASQAQQTINVAKKSQTITFSSTNPSPVGVGGRYTPTATASSGLTVMIALDATSTGCTLSSGVVSFSAAGVCIIDATQDGDDIWASAPPAQQSITIRASQALCESFGGTFATGTSPTLWTCSGLPIASQDADVASLKAACVHDGGNQFGQTGTVDTFDFECANPARAICASYGARFRTGTSGSVPTLWECDGVPISILSNTTQLDQACVADGGRPEIPGGGMFSFVYLCATKP